MKIHYLILAAAVALLPVPRHSTAAEMRAIPTPEPSVTPAPVHCSYGSGSFRLSRNTKIVYFESNSELKPTVDYVAEIMRRSTGFALPVVDGFRMPRENFIFLNYVRSEELGAEGYTLDADEKSVRIGANSGAGFFFAAQTLLHLFPPEIFSDSKSKNVKWRIPSLSLKDFPRFAWRGMHLDVSRHFFPKEFIKRYIDILALHKMNVFHWHLTDDQGWRIEIKGYPKLTETGAWRVNREERNWNDRPPQMEGEKAGYGGYYSEDEIREIVKYAGERFITIVPEIEMPAHSGAALASYPELTCAGKPLSVPPGGVWPITTLYCAGNESTFTFLGNVLGKVAELFPGKYIHAGGDEADKSEWSACPKCRARMESEGLKDLNELQSYFMKRIEKILRSNGKLLIGWDEILDGGLPADAAVMSWRGMEGGISAARQNHDVVMTPGSHCYFDYYQGKQDYEPPAIGGYTSLSKVYSFEPVPDSLSAEEKKHIIGAQANVWTEYIETPNHAEYMVMPRIAAMAEVVWSPAGSRSWTGFAARLENLMKRYDILKFNYARSAYLVRAETVMDAASKSALVSLSTEMPAPEIRYTTDGTEPAPESELYTEPFSVDKTLFIRAASFRDGKRLAAPTETKLIFHKALFRSLVRRNAYNKYSGGGDFALTNGIRGTIFFNDGNWQGYEENDFQGIIDLGETMKISRITAGFLQNTNSWIFFPTSIEYSVSEDGAAFVPVKESSEPVASGHRNPEIREYTAETDLNARFVKISAKNVKACPDWHAGRGGKTWIFIDEIIIE